MKAYKAFQLLNEY